MQKEFLESPLLFGNATLLILATGAAAAAAATAVAGAGLAGAPPVVVASIVEIGATGGGSLWKSRGGGWLYIC